MHRHFLIWMQDTIAHMLADHRAEMEDSDGHLLEMKEKWKCSEEKVKDIQTERDIAVQQVQLMEKEKSTHLCAICLTNWATVFFFRCRHYILCHLCWTQLLHNAEMNGRHAECPLCRTQIPNSMNANAMPVYYAVKTGEY